jgi:hypothetical protein
MVFMALVIAFALIATGTHATGLLAIDGSTGVRLINAKFVPQFIHSIFHITAHSYRATPLPVCLSRPLRRRIDADFRAKT